MRAGLLNSAVAIENGLAFPTFQDFFEFFDFKLQKLAMLFVVLANLEDREQALNDHFLCVCNLGE